MAKTTKAGRSTRRREELRRIIPRAVGLRDAFQRPEFVNAALILTAFIVAASTVVAWSREQPKVRDNQVMTSTRVKRLDYSVEDAAGTRRKRDEAAKSVPRVYRVNESYLDRLEAALLGLPKAVAGKTSLDEVGVDTRKAFNLDESSLRALQTMLVNDEPSRDWTNWVSRLVRGGMVNTPLLGSEEYERYVQTRNRDLRQADGSWKALPEQALEISIDASGTGIPDPRLADLVNDAGFPRQLQLPVQARLTFDLQPTLVYDENETKVLAAAAATAVTPEITTHRKGDVLYRRGDRLTTEQYAAVLTESEQFATRREMASERWQQRSGIVGLVAIMAVFVGSFAAIAYPRILRNPLRLGAVCALLASMVFLSVIITVNAPIFLLPAAIGPALFCTILLLIAYDQRFALLLAGIQCMIVTLALEQSIGFFILLLAGCATMAAQLKEVRTRNSLIRAASVTAAVLGGGTILLGLIEIPLLRDAFNQILVMALSAGLTSYGVSFLVLGILPSVERIFDITTGMTLAELRDPKRPLLRQLQQRAPGTYNHSLQVASIAEAAAEAISADSLLVYVGALYHDIGKINKPEYFIENQGGGINKHEKLSPAMSLLVIIGHVKNGIELAREYNLPRTIQHFIESHHGTTLVEYFYHAARTKAELADQAPVAEVEYRYPGPKPRTKEAAILMLSDAVESSARAMAEPTPSRIESLVRKLSARRLDDGQFDECELTFRELAMIEDAIINRMQAIYHSRISYPSSRPDESDHDADASSSTRLAVRPASA
jgi:putative nucleotidyltransferase with HDIG domain